MTQLGPFPLFEKVRVITVEGESEVSKMISTLKALVGDERKIQVRFLFELGVVMESEAYLREGYPSAFVLCTKGLGFSEGSASKRTKVARLGRRYPEVFERIASARLTLTSAYLLADVMTDENAIELLDRAQGKSKFEVEKLVATLSPEPDMEEMIRRLPEKTFSGESPLDTGTTTATSTPLPIPCRRDTVKPLSQTRTAFKFTGDDELVSMYRKLQDLMRHKYPKGRLEELVKEAFSTLLEKVDPAREPKRKVAVRSGTKHTRRIPASIRRAVWKRDQGRCTHHSAGGERCPATAFLQVDHVSPWSLGGSSHAPDNLALSCAAHNRWKGGAKHEIIRADYSAGNNGSKLAP